MASTTTPIPPTEPRPGSPNKDGPQKAPTRFIKNLLARASKQVDRFTEFVGLNKQGRSVSAVTPAHNELEVLVPVDSSDHPNNNMSPEVKKVLLISLKVGASILAAVVTL